MIHQSPIMLSMFWVLYEKTLEFDTRVTSQHFSLKSQRWKRINTRFHTATKQMLGWSRNTDISLDR